MKVVVPTAYRRDWVVQLATGAMVALVAFGVLPTVAEDRSDRAVLKAVVLGAEYGLAADDFGYIAVDVADGLVVSELNADETFMPASVVKIPTTVAALEVLGGDYRFATTIVTEGEVINGVLVGAFAADRIPRGG